MKKPILIPLCLLAGLALPGCSSFDQALGLSKSSPDEFQVVVRPPLTVPPNFSLDPVEDEATTQAPADAVTVSGAVLTGGDRTTASGFDGLFGLDRIRPGIRTTVDEETLGIQYDSRLPVHVLFGGQPNVGPTLSPEAEAIRIRDAQSRDGSLTDTPTPAVDPVGNKTVNIE